MVLPLLSHLSESDHMALFHCKKAKSVPCMCPWIQLKIDILLLLDKGNGAFKTTESVLHTPYKYFLKSNSFSHTCF
jgi:hypothetical protein